MNYCSLFIADTLERLADKLADGSYEGEVTLDIDQAILGVRCSPVSTLHHELIYMRLGTYVIAYSFDNLRNNRFCHIMFLLVPTRCSPTVPPSARKLDVDSKSSREARGMNM